MQRSERVADRQVRPHRRPVRKPGDLAHSAHCFADGGEPGHPAVRTGLAVARDAHQDESGVLARKRLPPEVPFLQRAGTEVLDHDVAVARRAPRDRLPFGLAQVERDRLLVARLHVPPQRHAVAHAPPASQRVAVARRLDLDHLGAEVRERLAAERPGDERAEFEDPYAGKWARSKIGVRARFRCRVITGSHECRIRALTPNYVFLRSRSGLYSRTTSPRWLTTLLAKRTRPRSPLEVRRCSITSHSTWRVSPTTVGPFTSSVQLRNARPVSCIVVRSRPSANEYTKAPGTARPFMARSESSVTAKSSSVSQVRLMNAAASASLMVRRWVRKRNPGFRSSKAKPRQPTKGHACLG